MDLVTSGSSGSGSVITPDWDSPSTKTGTVKRRPISNSDSDSTNYYSFLPIYGKDFEPNLPTNTKPKVELTLPQRTMKDTNKVFDNRRKLTNGNIKDSSANISRSKQNSENDSDYEIFDRSKLVLSDRISRMLQNHKASRLDNEKNNVANLHQRSNCSIRMESEPSGFNCGSAGRMLNRRTLDWVKSNSEQKFKAYHLANVERMGKSWEKAAEKDRAIGDKLNRDLAKAKGPRRIPQSPCVAVAKICDSLVGKTDCQYEILQ